MEFCLLGPLVVRLAGAEVRVPAGKQRAVLAALLLNAGRVVGLDELAEALWGAGPPPSARVATQNHVMRLRKALGEAGRTRIRTQPGGYLIMVAAGELDVSRFEALLAAAQVAVRDGSWQAAADRSRAALSLWRGEPLADTGSELLALREAPRLAELRLQALEARIEADLQLGDHSGVISELRRLAGLDPLRERLHGLLMLALYRDGRQGEALAAYRQARAVLVAELGTEPGAGLRLLQQQILTTDPALAAPEPGGPEGGAPEGGGPGPAVPRQLPGAVSHFTGRSAELAALSGLPERCEGPESGPVVISVISGTAGVGKTALAVHWARLVASRFPDGQLYVNLRGYDPGRPMSPASALAGFLRALGVSGPDIPAETDQRSARYRDLLAGRRVLVLLDNAGSVAQVRPLLPAAPSCMAVVTSRDALAGLVARDGAVRLDLDLLPPSDAAGLLGALIGDRAAADPAATAALADRCCRLPLALRVAAELAIAQRAVPLADLVGKLADQRRRLDLLDADGDPGTALRTVFSWSYRHLDPAAARAFRLAGLHPAEDLDHCSVAALSGATAEQAGRLLDQLTRAHLIHATGPGRHGMHDLLRGYARQLTAEHDGQDEQRMALTRLFDYYLDAAAAAMDALVPSERHHRPRTPRASTLAPPVSDPAAARAWLDAQRASLVAVAEHAAAHGWPAHATGLAATLFRYLDVAGHYPEAVTMHTAARRAARSSGDPAAEAEALISLSGVDFRQGRYPQATAHLRQALALCRDSGDRAGEARALNNLGNVSLQRGRYRQAAGHQRLALALYRETGDRTGEAEALGNLGIADLRQGRYRQATAHLQQALVLFRDSGDRTGQAYAIGNLGIIDLRQGRYPQAAGHHRQALALYRETGDPTGAAEALGNLGIAELRQGRYRQAAAHLRQALALCRASGDPAVEAQALNGLGEVLLVVGKPGQARARHAAALGLASRIGDTYEQARAHHGLSACHATDDSGLARHHWQQALSLYRSLGAPEADQLRDSPPIPGPVPGDDRLLTGC